MPEDIPLTKLILAPIILILTFFAVIVIHELGHYFMARLFKMPVKTVVIGRGRTLKMWDNKHGTRWSLRALPLGAYVQIEGYGDDSTTGFAAKPYHQRALTILGGPLINLAILPFLFFAFYQTAGLPATPATITGVEQNLAGERAGLQPGDTFTAINNQPLTNMEEVWRIAYSKGKSENLYTIKRGDQTLQIPIKPDWIEYKDDRGVPRANARFGLVWQHEPYPLDVIASINGTPTNKDEDLTRKRLIQNFDKPTLIARKGVHDEPTPTKIQLHADINQGLLDKDSERYNAVYFGKTGNIYQQKSTPQNAINAIRYTAKKIKTIASVPFQIFPIDHTMIHDSYRVSNPDHKFTNATYRILHLFTITSIAIALINLLPFPGLDGGHLLMQTIERIRRKPLTRKAKAKIFVACFALFYGTILLANSDNLPAYIDSNIKKVQELKNK